MYICYHTSVLKKNQSKNLLIKSYNNLNIKMNINLQWMEMSIL